MCQVRRLRLLVTDPTENSRKFGQFVCCIGYLHVQGPGFQCRKFHLLPGLCGTDHATDPTAKVRKFGQLVCCVGYLFRVQYLAVENVGDRPHGESERAWVVCHLRLGFGIESLGQGSSMFVTDPTENSWKPGQLVCCVGYLFWGVGFVFWSSVENTSDVRRH